ncbi:hypothetical protein M514_18836 [Trichuris suis]|uniref:Uncharacterized protein n=1 Tax=Trichuris suis TaxID=68888 RepID=A0A085NHT6_9BILA|nr:hypothetical protein M514_18836 [Trichuris suis]
MAVVKSFRKWPLENFTRQIHALIPDPQLWLPDSMATACNNGIEATLEVGLQWCKLHDWKSEQLNFTHWRAAKGTFFLWYSAAKSYLTAINVSAKNEGRDGKATSIGRYFLYSFSIGPLWQSNRSDCNCKLFLMVKSDGYSTASCGIRLARFSLF